MWPRSFSRYILREVFTLSIIMLVGSTMVIMLGVVTHTLTGAGLGANVFLQVLPYATVISLQFAVPSTLLFAVCSVYGRMAADNELVAVKSAGVHPYRVIVPVYVLGLIVSPFVVWLNDVAVSWARPGLNRIVLHSVEEIAYGYLSSRGTYESQSLKIHVEDVQDRWLIHATIFVNVGEDTNVITAERAKISLNEENETLAIELVNSEWESGKSWQHYGGESPTKLELPLAMASKKGQAAASISEIALSDMPVARADLLRETNTHEQAVLARCSTAMLTGNYSMLDDPITQNHAVNLKEVKKRSARLDQEPWRRWALGFSCLSFVFAGAPIAIHFRSANYATSFFVCFLPVLLVYYPLYAVGVDRAKSGHWPAYSPFLPNIFMLILGCYFLRKIYRN